MRGNARCKKYLQVVLRDGSGFEYEWDKVNCRISGVTAGDGKTLFYYVYDPKSDEILLCVPINQLNYYGTIERIEE